MIETLEIKRKWTCDLCHASVITHENPIGWVTIYGFEPDDSRPSPTLHLCPTCAVQSHQTLIKDKIIAAVSDKLQADLVCDWTVHKALGEVINLQKNDNMECEDNTNENS